MVCGNEAQGPGRMNEDQLDMYALSTVRSVRAEVCALLMRTRSTGFRSQLILYDVLFAELMLSSNKVALLGNFLPLQPRTRKISLTASGLPWLLVSEAVAQAYCSGPARACSGGACPSQPWAAEVSRRGWRWTSALPLMASQL